MALKEELLNQKILTLLEPYPTAKMLADLIIHDEEAHILQEYANTVSIRRLGFNDHGPVHMRQVTYNAVLIMELLKDAGIKTNLEEESIGCYEDSLSAVVLASFLHDSGMTLTRAIHEQTALVIDYPIINRFLDIVYPDNPQRYIIRSLAIEGILGHMATIDIHSREAGVVLVADGSDMEKGRARIPLLLHGDSNEARLGDIHKYSADQIEKVSIEKGLNKPIRITVEMNTSVGMFQVEEILLKKVTKSPILPHVELFAIIGNTETRQYL
ncbi:MAG: phosphohydrolase [Spirochaetia bacterium]